MNSVLEQSFEVAQFELIPASETGANFVREDTIGSKDPIVIIHPKNRVIMSESVVKQKNAKGDALINVPTRYIYGQEITDKKKQEEANINPNPKTDKIIFINGLLTVPKDGAFVGLFNFLKDHAQNMSNDNAPKTKDGRHIFSPIFREVRPAEDAHNNSMNDFLVSEAVMYVRGCVKQKGDKFVYDEDRIDVLSTIFGVVAETPQQKVEALIYAAKLDPQNFLSEAKKSEQVLQIEVSHGLKLKVIEFAGNSLVDITTEPPVKIKTFTGKITEENQITKAAQYFGTTEGKEAYELFKEKLAAAMKVSAEQN